MKIQGLALTHYGRCILAADFTAPVVSVHDGDTIEVLHNRHLNVSV